jgi:hypothetical protein
MFSNYDSVSEMLVGFNKSSASSNYEVSLEEGISVSTLFSLILALPGTRVHERYSIHFSFVVTYHPSVIITTAWTGLLK